MDEVSGPQIRCLAKNLDSYSTVNFIYRKRKQEDMFTVKLSFGGK